MTQSANPDKAVRLMELGGKMRVGRKLGRTLYLTNPNHDEEYAAHLCVGIVDSHELAAEICARWNAGL